MIRGISDDILSKVYDFSEMTNEELRCKFFQKLQECIDLCNNTSDIIEWIKDVQLPKEVKDLLSIWLEDGTLESLININILNKKVDTETFNSTISTINEQIENIDKQIDLNVLEYGCKGDGVTDNTEIIKSIINSLDGNKSYNIKFPSGNYVITDEIVIGKDNITIDFMNSNIIFKSDNGFVFGNNNGVFKFFKSYVEYNNLITSVDNFYRIDTYRNQIVTKLTLTDNNFSVGDVISVLLHVGTEPFTTKMPCISTVAEIIEVNGKDIVINYYCPYDFKQYNNSFTVNRIRKYNVVNNVAVKNANFTHFNRIQDISPFSFVGCKNVTVSNCKYTLTSLPCVNATDCINVLTENNFLKDPLSVVAGKGYLTKYVSCRNGVVENCKGENVRHLVDFSGGWMLSAKNCTDNTPNSLSTGSFDCHGIGEHTITYDNCNGSFSFGNGTQFPQIIKDIKINNSFITDLINACYVNINITNSKITFNYKNALFFDKLNVSNSSIILCPSSIGHVDIRGFNTSEVSFDNCSFLNRELSSKSNIYIKNFENAKFTNCDINNNKDLGALDFSGCNNVSFDNSKINKCEITIYGNIILNKTQLISSKITSVNNVEDNRVININGCSFKCNGNDRFINFTSINKTNRLNVILRFNDNFIDNIDGTTEYYILYNNSNHYVYPYASRNVARKAIIKSGSSTDLFASDGSISVLNN